MRDKLEDNYTAPTSTRYYNKPVGIQGELPEEHQSSYNCILSSSNIRVVMWDERCSSLMPATQMTIKNSEEVPTGAETRWTELKCRNCFRMGVG